MLQMVQKLVGQVLRCNNKEVEIADGEYKTPNSMTK
jgi:hypothetical protein